MNAPTTTAKADLKRQVQETREAEQDLFRIVHDGPALPKEPFFLSGNESNPQEKERPKFSFVAAGNLVRDIGPTDWLIADYLEAGALAVLFGAPETFKSFAALDMACCIATRTKYHGAEVKQGPAFIIIGEGQRGYGRRLAAWQKVNSRFLEDYPVFISTTSAQFMDANSAEDVARAIQALEAEHGKPVLIIIDTLARNFGPGDENSTKDMTAFVANLDSHIGTDCTRLLVHHTGLQADSRARGSSVLRGALDVEMKVTRQENGTVELSCSKMKDAERFKPITFEPQIVEVGLTDNLEPITSLVLSKCDPAEKEAPKLSTQMEKAINLLQFIGGKSCLRCMAEWQAICDEEQVYARTSFYRAVDKLRDKGIVEISGDYVRLSPVSPTVSD